MMAARRARYGEFPSGTAGGDVEALAVAVPADALSGGVPVALGRLGTAASGIEASLDVQQSVLDQQLRYEPRGAVDRDRLELWCRRLRADARARRAAAVSGDAATLTWIRDRIAGLTPKEQHSLDAELSRVQAAADARRTAVAADHAARLIGLLRAIPRPQAVD